MLSPIRLSDVVLTVVMCGPPKGTMRAVGGWEGGSMALLVVPRTVWSAHDRYTIRTGA